jgi:hypothetical protein
MATTKQCEGLPVGQKSLFECGGISGTDALELQMHHTAAALA